MGVGGDGGAGMLEGGGGSFTPGLGGGGYFMGFGTRVLPDPDDSGTNDEILLLRASWPSLPQAWTLGKDNLVQLVFRVLDNSGAMSNTWRLKPYLVPNSHEDRPNWDLWPFPRGVFGELLPFRSFTEADLPLVGRIQVPMKAMMADWGILFERSGAGNHTLEVQVWTDSFVMV